VNRSRKARARAAKLEARERAAKERKPLVGRYFIRKTFGKWSSNTVVEIYQPHPDYQVSRDHAVVMHEPTREVFEIPEDLLVKVRRRY
jgi:hypothetical protein